MSEKITLALFNEYKRYIYSPYDCDDVDPRECILNIYFGLPGAGKSSYAAFLAVRDMKHNRAVYSNFPITGAFQLDATHDLGTVNVCNGRVILDEASIEFNSRDYKNFSKNLIKFFKYHRHYSTIVDVFSQAPDDVDITIRRLAYNFFWIRKSILPYFISITPITHTIDVIDGEIKSSYVIERSIFRRKLVFVRPYWKYFNTLSREKLPEKEWSIY